MLNQTTDLKTALISLAGACLVACIAGAFSLVGILIAKEQDVSKFRQAWIDDLREDVAGLIAHALSICSYRAACVSGLVVLDWHISGNDFLELNKASTRIKLRLNRSECESRLILQSMEGMEKLFAVALNNNPAITLDRVNKIAAELEHDMPPLLKKEWQRVKSGEPTYRVAKWAALILFVASGAAALFLFARFPR